MRSKSQTYSFVVGELRDGQVRPVPNRCVEGGPGIMTPGWIRRRIWDESLPPPHRGRGGHPASSLRDAKGKDAALSGGGAYLAWVKTFTLLCADRPSPGASPPNTTDEHGWSAHCCVAGTMPAAPVRPPEYRRRKPEKEPLYQILAASLHQLAQNPQKPLHIATVVVQMPRDPHPSVFPPHQHPSVGKGLTQPVRVVVRKTGIARALRPRTR